MLQGKHEVKGLGFDATCSLVIQSSEDLKWDIIMWMDHRAQAETDLINNQGHAVLDYVGGKVSLEMQTPKLLWLKRNKAQCLKITEKVSFNIASEASYVYILSGQKLIKNAQNGPFWRVFEILRLAVKQCYQAGQF